MNIQKKCLKVLSVVFFSLIVSMSSARAALMEFDSLDSQYTGQLCGVTCGILDIEAVNNTDFVWTDFHISSNLGSFGPESYEGAGTATFSNYNFTLDIVDLSIDMGESLFFAVDNTCFGEVCSLGVVYTAYPTIDGGGDGDIDVPEPATLMLMGVGLAGLGFARRKR